MIELLELLQLDVERVRAVARARHSLGISHFRRSPNGEAVQVSSLLAAVTHWRVAGGLWLLADEVTLAHELFRRAADELSRMRQPFGVLLRSLSEPEREATWADARWLYLDEREEIGGSHVFLLMHPLVLSRGSDLKAASLLRARLESLAGWQVGRLGLTVRTYLDIYDTMAQGDFQEVGLTDAITPVVAAFGHLLADAMEDSYHWQRLRSSLNPVEPEVAGVLSSLARAMGPDGEERVPRAVVEVPTSSVAREVLSGIVSAVG